eukprot:CAMPEP_0177774664 /NCGR_PEP_ID=MMETSP0491_2-20121128/13654_1 /TAXON_ID=63592 /ORGANISM="Tetraselmis chuii, Strain PLY429" /LENGTH=127 /DNA_ID=CAMNT_0019293111 /DNA_START=1008 /DNA_END=1391 /DNA_ORIENTATION=+
MKTRQTSVLPASHTPRNIRLVSTPSTGQKPRQGSAHKALDDDNAPQGPPAQRSPRPGHAATASAMLGAGETPAASKAAMAAHDGEMRAMKRKGKKGAMFGGESKKRDHNPNTYTRKRHFIGQPRKFN